MGKVHDPALFSSLPFLIEVDIKGFFQHIDAYWTPMTRSGCTFLTCRKLLLTHVDYSLSRPRSSHFDHEDGRWTQFCIAWSAQAQARWWCYALTSLNVADGELRFNKAAWCWKQKDYNMSKWSYSLAQMAGRSIHERSESQFCPTLRKKKLHKTTVRKSHHLPRSDSRATALLQANHIIGEVKVLCWPALYFIDANVGRYYHIGEDRIGKA